MKKKTTHKKLVHKNERGFTLIEILLAIAMLGIVVIALYMGLSTAFKAYGVSNQRATAMALAQSQLEYIEKRTYSTVYPIIQSPEYVVPGNFSITVDSPEINTNLQKITVGVFFKGSLVYTVDDYKVKKS